MKTILVVEDAADYAENLKFVLTKGGYQVEIALNGMEGLKAALRLRPDLILMDVLLPDQDGIETTVKIREQMILKDVPILFLTAVTGSENVVISVRGKDYPGISKMIDYEKIVAQIRHFVGK